MERQGQAPVIDPAAALLPLRLFLGATFVYAGVQKLSDPGFLHKGAPTYIGSQLHGFAQGTPGGFLLKAFAIPHAEAAGVGVAVLEITVGLLVLVGLLTQLAAATGLGLNLILFLTASWKTSPYFLGSDIVFVFAWLPFVLTGSSGQPAVDNALGRWARRGPPWAARSPRRATVAGRRAPTGHAPLTRRALLLQALGLTGAGTLLLGSISALAKGSYHGGGGASLASTRAARKSTSAPPAHRSPSGGSSRARVPSGAVELGPSSRLPAGQGATYSDPTDGQPGIVIRQPDGKLTAFSAVCTHAGCTVGYQSNQIVCPCHGAVYSPRTGAVEGGPAPQGLTPKRVLESGGRIYAVPS